MEAENKPFKLSIEDLFFDKLFTLNIYVAGSQY